jgi:hypothetical protein
MKMKKKNAVRQIANVWLSVLVLVLLPGCGDKEININGGYL